MNELVYQLFRNDSWRGRWRNGRRLRIAFVTCLLALGLSQGIFTSQAAHVEQAWSAQQTGHQGGVLAADDAGNIYVTSYSQTSTSQWDIVLTKYASGGTKLWQSRYDALLQNDFPYALAVKGTNVIVAGQTFNPDGTADFITLKYNTNGVLQWSARYNGPANRSERATAVELGVDGSVVVAGDSAAANDASDMVALKYDASGNLLWAFRYDGPGQNYDHVAGMKLDAQGNVYLAGSSGGIAGRSAVATVKLDAAGHQLWAARFLSSSDRVEFTGRALALDGAGNVITVGEEAGEWLTIKYAAGGTLLWTARYRAEEPASMYMVDLRVDAANNIVAAGNLFGSATNDAVLVKYDSTGQQLWASRIAHPQHAFHLNAIDMDSAGNTYLTGTPHNDALTVKVDPNGNQIWSISYNSTDEFYDNGESLKLDGLGNVLISGRSVYFGENFLSVVKYRQNTVAGAPQVSLAPTNQSMLPGGNVTFTAAATGAGPLQYQWRFTGRAIPGATSSSLTITNVQVGNRGDYSVAVSNVFGVATSPEVRLTVLVPPIVAIEPGSQSAVAGSDATFIALAEGTAPFTFQWRHQGTNIPGATSDLIQLTNLGDPDAGAYSVVAVNAAGSVTSSVVALSISHSVQQLQSTRYDGPFHGTDQSSLLHVSTNGEAIVVATSTGATTSMDIVVMKYSGSGTQLWASTYNHVGQEVDVPADLAVDSAGNIYVTGFSGENYYYHRVFTTLKYDGEGHLLWARHFRETNSQDSFATSIAIGPQGTVSVAGKTEGTAIVLRYDAAGNELWIARGANSYYYSMAAVVVDTSGNTYLGSSQVFSNSASYCFLRKINPAGGEVWTRVFKGGSDDSLNALALDRAGNLVVAGTSFMEPAESLDTVVFKYTPDGTQLWATNVHSQPNQENYTRALAVGETDDIFVVASLEGDDADPLVTGIMKLTSDGHLAWTEVEPTLRVSEGTRIAVDRLGSVLVTGGDFRLGAGSHAVTVKYDSAGTQVWLAHYAGVGSGYDFGTAVALDGLGAVYVAGYGSALIGVGSDMLLLKYRDVATDWHHRIGAHRTTNGLFRLEASPGANFAVEVSTDLIHWSRIDDAEEVERLFEGGVTISTSTPGRFYRLVFLE